MFTAAILSFSLMQQPCCIQHVQAMQSQGSVQFHATTKIVPDQTPNQATKSDTKGATAVLNGLTETAKKFQESVANVTQMLKDSANSREQGEKALDTMLNAMRGVEESVSDKGQIWQEFSTTIARWQKNQQAAEAHATEDPAFRAQADAWADKVHTAADLRSDIIKQRDKVQSMIAQVQQQRELVLGWYELDQANKALEGLRQIDSQLTGLNNDLNNMIQQARKMGPGV